MAKLATNIGKAAKKAAKNTSVKTTAKSSITRPYLTESEIKRNYQNQYNAYAKQKRTEANRAKTATNASYDSAQRQNYVNYMSARKELPESLARQGITGGMSETSALRARTNYQNLHSSTERSRRSDIANIRNNLNDNLNTYKMTADQSMNSDIASNRQLRSNYEQQRQQRREERFANNISGYTNKNSINNAIKAARKNGETWKIPYLRNQLNTVTQQKKAEKQARLEQREQRFANNINGYTNTASIDKAIKAARKNKEYWKIPYLDNQRAVILQRQKSEQEQRASQYEQRFANTISGYDTISGIDKEISAIRKAGVDTWRIPYLRARRAELVAAQAEAASSGSSGSGSGGSSGGRSSSSKSGNNSNNNNNNNNNNNDNPTKETPAKSGGDSVIERAQKVAKEKEQAAKKAVAKKAVGGLLHAGNKKPKKTVKQSYKRTFAKNSKTGKRISQWVK